MKRDELLFDTITICQIYLQSKYTNLLPIVTEKGHYKDINSNIIICNNHSASTPLNRVFNAIIFPICETCGVLVSFNTINYYSKADFNSYYYILDSLNKKRFIKMLGLSLSKFINMNPTSYKYAKQQLDFIFEVENIDFPLKLLI